MGCTFSSSASEVAVTGRLRQWRLPQATVSTNANILPLSSYRYLPVLVILGKALVKERKVKPNRVNENFIFVFVGSYLLSYVLSLASNSPRLNINFTE